jgi:hypothetical protein
MPLETATTIDQLVPANPAHSDGLNQTDAHLRLLKATVQASFPNLVGAAAHVTSSGVTKLPDGTSAAPSIAFAAEATTGLYRASAGHLGIAGRLTGNGAVPVGSMHSFPIDPGASTVARGGTATGTEQFVECDGATYLNTKFPDLAAFLGQGGTSFTVPGLTDTGRFIRSRTSTLTVGTKQANSVIAHNHTVGGVTVAAAGAHTHTFTSNVVILGTLTATNATFVTSATGASVVAGSGSVSFVSTGNPQITIPNFQASGTTDSSGSHTHTLSGATDNNGTATETRPESFVAVVTLKT